MTQNKPPFPWPTALALTLACSFVGIALYWENQSAHHVLWGDSFPNAEQLMMSLKTLDRVGFKGLFYHENLYSNVVRAPGLPLYLSLWLKVFGIHPQTLVLAMSTALAGSGLLLYFALLRGGAGAAAGILAMALFLGSPETVSQAHNVLQVGVGVFGLALAYYGLVSCWNRERLGAILLGFGLAWAMMTRRQFVAIAFIPCALLALPALLSFLKQSPFQALLRIALLPFLAFATAGLPLLLSVDASPWLVESSWLFLALGIALSLWHPTRMQLSDLGKRGAAYGLGLAIGASMILPWYLNSLKSSADHLEQSGALSYFTTSNVIPLIRFQYLSMVIRGLQPVALPLLLIGLLIALWKWKRPAFLLPILGLLVAQGFFFTFFHARYAFPLSLWGAAFGGFAIIPLKKWAWLPAGGFLALSLLRVGGWMLPISLPTESIHEVGLEHQSWHEDSWRNAFSHTGPGQQPFPYGLFTLAPETQKSPLPALTKRAESACPSQRNCAFVVFNFPQSLPYTQDGGAYFESSFNLNILMPESRLEPRLQLSGGQEQIALLLYTSEKELRDWMAFHKNVPFQVVEMFEENGYNGLILMTLESAPDGSIGVGWSPPPPFNWPDPMGD